MSGNNIRTELESLEEEGTERHEEQKPLNSDIEVTETSLVYGINDNPPIHVMLVAALQVYQHGVFQQGLLSLASQLTIAILVADAVCATNDEVLKARILSSTLFMDGLTTIAMVVLGVRLPIFQGAAVAYVIPLLMISSIQSQFCDGSEKIPMVNGKVMANFTEQMREKAILNLRGLQGSLMLAGFLQAIIGLTGLVGILLRFVGPITIVTSMFLGGIYLVTPVTNFAEVHWGMSSMTLMIAIILFLYLGNRDMPIPIWTPSGGGRIIRYPLHQMFAILFSMLIGWLISGILTYFGVFSDDPQAPDYNARTDSRIDVVDKSQWFLFPYPGQFGSPLFSIPGFVSFIIATVLAILDSVGDYYACARICRVPPPPAHAVNRGILIEGICSFLNGVVGCGHGTNSYGGNVGAIGVTKIASRSVFVCTGIIYLVFGVIGKFSAVFIAIPYPVLGGALIMLFGMYIGLVLSNLETLAKRVDLFILVTFLTAAIRLQKIVYGLNIVKYKQLLMVVSLSSSRNLAVLGISIFIGLIIPQWFIKNPQRLQTGSDSANKLITMVLSNPNLAGTIIACFLDNSVPGTAKARGIEAWQVKEDDDAEIDETLYDHGMEVYKPIMPKRWLSWRLMKYIPFMPNPKLDINRKPEAVNNGVV